MLSISDNVTESTVDTYSAAVSLLIESKSLRLLTDNIDEALGANNSKARGKVEKALLEQALSGSGGSTWLPSGNDAVTIFPLTWDAHPGCITCHTEFAGLEPDTIIGGLLIRVPMND